MLRHTLTVIGVALSLCAVALTTRQTLADQPNILLIMVDDMGWSDVGCYGSEIRTPNIDSLAAKGMRFTQFYNNGKCTTTRASLLTGVYPRNGGRGDELISDRMLTLAEALHLAGYQTGMSGKWHNGSRPPHRPIDRGFDRSYGLWDGCCNFFDPAQPDPTFKGGRVRFFGENDRQIEDFPADFYTTDAFTDHAIETITAHAATGEPFFHYLAYTAPHYPLHARPEDIAKYKGMYKGGWDQLRASRYARQIAMGLIDSDDFPDPGPNPNNQPFASGRSADEEWEMLRMEVYAAMVDRVDQNIGRLLTALEELAVAENTLILFLSDNGACAETPGGADNTTHRPGPKDWYSHVGPNWAYAQNTPFRSYKAHTHEGGIATPLIARWPGKIAPNTLTTAVGHIIDLMPTFLDVAGGQYPEASRGGMLIPLEGVSLLPVLRSEVTTVDRRTPLFWHWGGHRAVRLDDMKAVWENERTGWELYDLSVDRTETDNLAQSRPQVVESLARQWADWARLTGIRVKDRQ